MSYFKKLFFNWIDLHENFGTQTADFHKNIANEMLNKSCELWNQFPHWFTRRGNPLSSFMRGYFNGICSNNPPAPTSPFSGGQCCDILYTVRCRVVIYRCAGDKVTDGIFTPTNVFGSILGYEFRQTRINYSVAQIKSRKCNGEIVYKDIMTTTRKLGCPGGENIDLSKSFVEIQSITRQDNLPDDCGSLPPAYPPAPDPPPRIDWDINIPNADGLDFTIPLVWVKPEANFDFNFGLDFNLGGINFTFDLGGLHFYAPDANFNFDNDLHFYPSVPPAPLPDGQPPPVVEPSPPAPPTPKPPGFPPPPANPDPEDDAGEKTEEEQQQEDEEPPEIEYKVFITPVFRYGRRPAVGDLVQVEIFLGNYPANTDLQYGFFPEGTITRAGWFQFLAGDFPMPRIRIESKSLFLPVPPKANGFQYTCTDFATASVRYIVRVVKEE